jgi:hypothetical protein
MAAHVNLAASQGARLGLGERTTPTRAAKKGTNPENTFSRRPMIAKTLFLAKIIHRIGAKNIRGKKTLRQNSVAYRAFFAFSGLAGKGSCGAREQAFMPGASEPDLTRYGQRDTSLIGRPANSAR